MRHALVNRQATPRRVGWPESPLSDTAKPITICDDHRGRFVTVAGQILMAVHSQMRCTVRLVSSEFPRRGLW